jgi:YgiT-type zinc finger domain-containing protein
MQKTKSISKDLSNAIGVEYCDFCDGAVKPEKVTMTYKRLGKEYVFNNVDAEVCQECGVKYLHARTLKELDRRISEGV